MGVRWRLPRAGVATAVAVACSATVAGATPNFGLHSRNDNVGVMRGTRSEIKTPSSEINWGTTTGELFLARVTGELDNGTFLVQVGFGETSPSDTFDACGSKTTFHRFNEYLLSGVYTCNWFGAPGTSQNDEYAVKRVAEVPQVCLVDCWSFLINGTSVDKQGTNVDSVDTFYAGEEFNNCKTCGIAAAKSAPALYGASGTQDWQWTDTIGGATWTTITGGGTVNTDGSWSLGLVPTPSQSSIDEDLRHDSNRSCSGGVWLWPGGGCWYGRFARWAGWVACGGGSDGGCCGVGGAGDRWDAGAASRSVQYLGAAWKR